jgi:hypothetical protein
MQALEWKRTYLAILATFWAIDFIVIAGRDALWLLYPLFFFMMCTTWYIGRTIFRQVTGVYGRNDDLNVVKSDPGMRRIRILALVTIVVTAVLLLRAKSGAF